MSIDVQSAPALLGAPSASAPRPVLHSGASTAAFIQPSTNTQTVSEVFLRTVQEHGTRTALTFTQTEESTSAAGTPERHSSVRSWTWNEYGEAATRFAKALVARGVGPQDVVTIQGSNSPHWLTAHLGTILASGVSTGVYPTNAKELCEHIVTSTGARIAVVEDESQLKKYDSIQSTALKCIVVWNKVQQATTSSRVPVLSMDEFLRSGDSVPDTELRRRVAEQKPDDPCSLVFTSGTTGNPKAAALTHRNFISTAAKLKEKYSLNQDHRSISFLPLSHVAPMLLDTITPLLTGHSLYLAPPDALKGTNLKDHIVRAKPTYFMAVPRVWEKFKEAMEAKLASASFLTRHIFSICTTIGRAVSSDFRSLSAEPSLSIFQRIRQVFDRCVLWLLDRALFGKVKAALGIDQCQFAATGAGSISQEVRDFFDGLNVHILDFYGMSESTGPMALSDDTTPSGSCGKPIPGSEIRIINPDENGEGEILTRGPHVFSKYWRDPQATPEALDDNGFLHTGDKGRLDADGNLYVTGRLKEIIKTSGGENIPPLRIEDRIKAQLPIISQAVVLGNNRHYLTCLVSLKTEVDDSGAPTDQLAPEVIATIRKVNSVATTLHQAAADQAIRQLLMQAVQKANQLADSHAQFVQKIAVLREEFSIANGTLTPTLKIRRAIVEKKYQREIAEMYA
jgi:long-chain-fatty-acid--CoA ligase ACSBG